MCKGGGGGRGVGRGETYEGGEKYAEVERGEN